MLLLLVVVDADADCVLVVAHGSLNTMQSHTAVAAIVSS